MRMGPNHDHHAVAYESDNHDATPLLEEAFRRRKPQTTCERP